MKIRKIFEQCDNDKLVLPDFQRDFVWKTDGIKRLLSSFMLKIPIGSFLILEGKAVDFKSRQLCFPNREIIPKEECLYLLDGQQRLSVLKVAFDDLYRSKEEWKKQWEDTYSQLHQRWFIRIIPKENEEDIFGWRNLSFPDWSTMEPQQLLEFIENKAIFKTTNIDKWYHPAYDPQNENGESLSSSLLGLSISKNAYSEGGFVPLYSLYSPNITGEKPLHERVLGQIAQRRIEELEALSQDGKVDIISILERVEPEISALIENKETEKIKLTWLKLNAQWVSDVQKYFESLLEQELHDITLESKEIGRAISIFENINQGGTELDVYDLVVAKAARDSNLPSLTQRLLNIVSNTIDLPSALKTGLLGGDAIPEQWNPENIGSIEDYKPMRIFKNQYLNLLSIVAYCGDNLDDLKTEHIKRGKILGLNYEQINANTEQTVKALMRAFAFLQFRCGIVNLQNVPYELMILPIAYYLRKDENWTNNKVISRLEYWYWTSIFGGAYRQAQNDRTIKDLKALKQWIYQDDDFLVSIYPSVLNYQGYSDKDVLMMNDPDNSVSGALYNAVLQYILSQQPYDFLPDNPIRLNPWDIAINKEFDYEGNQYNLSIHDHHVVPLGSATSIGKSSEEIRRNKNHILNSVLNRTYISAKANNLIRSMKPEEYLSYMSELALYGQYIPCPVKEQFRRIDGENDILFYERLLNMRYEKIREGLIVELDKLKFM